MKCPACEHEFSLTWTRYLEAPFGRMDCPLCRKKLMCTHRWFYWPIILIGMCIPGIPLAAFGSRYGSWGTLAGWIIGAISTGVPLDRFLEGRFSVLEIGPEEVSREAINSDD